MAVVRMDSEGQPPYRAAREREGLRTGALVERPSPQRDELLLLRCERSPHLHFLSPGRRRRAIGVGEEHAAGVDRDGHTAAAGLARRELEVNWWPLPAGPPG